MMWDKNKKKTIIWDKYAYSDFLPWNELRKTVDLRKIVKGILFILVKYFD